MKEENDVGTQQAGAVMLNEGARCRLAEGVGGGSGEAAVQRDEPGVSPDAAAPPQPGRVH